MIEGEDFYYDRNGYIVFTAAYHEKKGYCCGNGCRHCPFDYENVPEPKRSQLLSLHPQISGKSIKQDK